MPKSSPAHVWYLTIDCRDPDALAAFWSKLLGLEIKGHFGSSDYLTMLARPGDDAVALAFQRVPEPKTVKNRAHPDLEVSDLEAVTRLAVSLGATVVADQEEDDYRWRVLQDPEGNEFCLMPNDEA
ncbi:MAG TPA: VOC family protein [Actinomycetota bacterium]|nr:VOC family protein [Actinomycetota bacterium]